MSATSTVRRGRRAAVKLMIDRCVVTRADTSAPVDDRGLHPQVTVYEGRAKSQTYEGYEANPVAGRHSFTVQRYAAHFPIGSFRPKVGDLVTWTRCPGDPDRVGTVDRIAGPFAKSLSTAQRVFVDRMQDD